MIVSGWIIGIMLLLVGFVGYLFCKMFQPLHDAEVKLMKTPNGGRFEEEPIYMKTFREDRAEEEAVSNFKRAKMFYKIAFVGAILIASMITLLFI